MKVGVVGASGYAGVELLRLCACTPTSRWRWPGPARHAGQAVGAHTPSLAAAYPSLAFGATQPAISTGSTSCSWPCPMASHNSWCPSCESHVGVVVDLAADFRLRDPSLYPDLVRGRAPPLPTCWPRFATDSPSFPRRAARRPAIAAPGCYPTAVAGPRPPLRCRGRASDRSAPARRRCAPAACPAPVGRPEANLHFATVDEDFAAYGLLNHRHTAEIEQGLGAQVLFTPHVAPMVRGILATCYARPADRTAVEHRRRPGDLLHDRYREEPFVVVTDGAAVDQGHLGSNTAHLSVRVDPRTGWIVALSAIDNLVKGASGQAVQCANLALGLPEDHRPSPGRGCTREHHHAEGLRGRWLASGIKASGALDLALVATDDGAPVPTAATFTSNLAAAAPVQVSRAHLGPPAGGPRPWWCAAGTPTPPPGTGVGPTPRPCAALAATGLGCPPTETAGLLHGADRHPAADGADRVGHPGSGGRPGSASAQAAERRGLGDPHDRLGAQGGAGRRTGFTVAGMAKGAGMLAPDMATMLAFLTTDAAVEPDALADLLRIAVPARSTSMSVDGCTSTNDTVVLMAIGPGRAVRPDACWRCGQRGLRRPGRPDGADAEGASKIAQVRVTGARSRRRSPPGRPARWPTPCWSSARSTARTPTGAGWPATSALPASTSTWTG